MSNYLSLQKDVDNFQVEQKLSEAGTIKKLKKKCKLARKCASMQYDSLQKCEKCPCPCPDKKLYKRQKLLKCDQCGLNATNYCAECNIYSCEQCNKLEECKRCFQDFHVNHVRGGSCSDCNNKCTLCGVVEEPYTLCTAINCVVQCCKSCERTTFVDGKCQVCTLLKKP